MKLKLPGIVTFAAALALAVAFAVGAVVSAIYLIQQIAAGHGDGLVLSILTLGGSVALAVVLLIHGLKGLLNALKTADEGVMVGESTGAFMKIAAVNLALSLATTVYMLIYGALYIEVAELIMGIAALALFFVGRMLFKGGNKLVGVILLMIVPVVELVKILINIQLSFITIWATLESIATFALVGGTVWLLVYVLLNTLKGSKAE